MFLFGENSDTEVLHDFEQGTDLIRLQDMFGLTFGDAAALDAITYERSWGVDLAFSDTDRIHLVGIAKEDVSWSDFEAF